MTKTTRLAIGITLGFLSIVAIWLYLQRAPLPDGLVLRKTAFSDLAGWGQDEQSAALVALRRSCQKISRLADARSLGGGGIAGRAADWKPICRALPGTGADDQIAREFFTTWFAPHRAVNQNGYDANGLFTGYYEPALRGSRRRAGPYQTPLYTRPDDLITVDLSAFRHDLEGRRIAGRLKAGKLTPYPTRAEIVAGGLGENARPLVWIDDPVAAFFLQIQGSGRVELAGGGEMRVGFAATNGQPYTAIGRELVRSGALTRAAVSLQSIRAWLAANPDQAAGIMALNRSYVFFRELTGPGPIGAQGVALTPRRSLAVDRKYIPLGLPVWLEATAPGAEPGAPDQRLRRLMVAQDTGGAIRGPVRGDVFWGYGAQAERIAGGMKHPGRYFLLLPKTMAMRIEAPGDKNNAD